MIEKENEVDAHCLLDALEIYKAEASVDELLAARL